MTYIPGHLHGKYLGNGARMTTVKPTSMTECDEFLHLIEQVKVFITGKTSGT